MSGLSLAEELFLLGLHDEKAKVHDAVALSIHYGLGGAILADLALQKRIALDIKGKVIFIEISPCGDEILDEACLKISNSPKIFKDRHWVEEFSNNIKKLQKRLADTLVDKRVLSKTEDKYAWVVPYPGNSQLEASAKYWIKSRLREILLANRTADEHDIVLLCLIQACSMLHFVVTRDEQKVSRIKIKELINNEKIDKAVLDAVEIIEASAVTAAMIASVG